MSSSYDSYDMQVNLDLHLNAPYKLLYAQTIFKFMMRQVDNMKNRGAIKGFDLLTSISLIQ